MSFCVALAVLEVTLQTSLPLLRTHPASASQSAGIMAYATTTALGDNVFSTPLIHTFPYYQRKQETLGF